MAWSGTSPRTRGKRQVCLFSVLPQRNIPAHAGKTTAWSGPSTICWEHPRARGENNRPRRTPRAQRGTSPRTRGKPIVLRSLRSGARNIPAHAGKTCWGCFGSPRHGEHPRARGENGFTRLIAYRLKGTSSRTRGKQTYHILSNEVERNIPAHAGKTFRHRAEDFWL